MSGKGVAQVFTPGLFGSSVDPLNLLGLNPPDKPEITPNPPPTPAPAVMPTPSPGPGPAQDPNVRRAQKRSVAQQIRRRGRASTILTERGSLGATG
jgi:hypothetical protein